MKKWYKEYFYIAPEGSVREKVMLSRITVSIVLILVCMAAMSFTAYAYFTSSISSASTILQSAVYDLEISQPAGAIEVNGLQYIENNTGQDAVYTFEVSKGAKNTATVGYIKITVITDQGDVDYYTKPIGKFMENGHRVFMTFPSWTMRISSVAVPAVKRSLQNTAIPIPG